MFENENFGIFSDFPGPVMTVAKGEKKPQKKKETAKKKPAGEVRYKTPARILFDSISAVEIREEGAFTKKEIFLKIAEITGYKVFSEQESGFMLRQVKEGYLVRPGYSSRIGKGGAGKSVLLEKLWELNAFVAEDGEEKDVCERIRKQIQTQYHMNTALYLLGDVYIPVPGEETKGSLDDLKFPILVSALTFYGETLEIGEEDYRAFMETEKTVPEEGTVTLSDAVIRKILATCLPEYADDLEYAVDTGENRIQVFHKSDLNRPAATIKKEETYPTDAVISLVFTRIQLSPEMFGGAKEATEKEIIRKLGKEYPEYSLERTELRYDKKERLIIPVLKSGKRGLGEYCLEDTAAYRYEESPLMAIRAYKECPDADGCVRGELELHIPRIPFPVLKEVIGFFWDVYVLHQTEAVAQIFYSRKTGMFKTYIPRQTVSRADVVFDRDYGLETDPDWILVMEIHSHGACQAFWSKTDNQDELSHRLYAVAGGFSDFRYDSAHIRVRGATGGYHVKVDAFCVFRFPQSREEMNKELAKVELAR